MRPRAIARAWRCAAAGAALAVLGGTSAAPPAQTLAATPTGTVPTAASAPSDPRPAFSELAIRRILLHGPWPQPVLPDPSNRVSGRPEAVSLGRRLFFDTRLSAGHRLACATCHRPELAWTDGLARAQGLERVDRNTLPLVDLRLNRWYGWDGAGDSLWAQSIRPLLDPREMGVDAERVAGLLRGDPALAAAYRRAFGRGASEVDAEAALVDAAKALAAFQETIRAGRSAFDAFRDALARGDREGMARYPAAAQRGLELFVGKGHCSVCHFGPSFTNGEFADIGMPFFAAPGRVDPGRHGGIARLRASRFNLLGPYNDDPARSTATAVRHVEAVHRNFGEFRVPGLRNVARTAPYMHDGRLATLREVVRHYAELDEDRLHADGERILRRLALSPGEIDDLVAFLESLDSEIDSVR